MTPILYDFLADLSATIERKGIERIHRITFNFEEGIYELMHHTNPKQYGVQKIYFDCSNYGDLKLALTAGLPSPSTTNLTWLLWGGYFDVMYNQYQRLRIIDAILPTL